MVGFTQLLALQATFAIATAFAFHSASRNAHWQQEAGTSHHVGTATTTLFASGPRSSERRTSRRSPPRERRTRPAEVFDGRRMTSQQDSNEASPMLFDLSSQQDLRCRTHDALQFSARSEALPYTFVSLDDVFVPGTSHIFNTNATFRDALRMSIRQDIFDSTPYYATLSDKAKSVLLMPDSSLEGSWNPKATFGDGEAPSTLRMKKTTTVLHDAVTAHSATTDMEQPLPTGDDFMAAIGALCGTEPSTHWIDIVGILDRKISHSWHQDASMSKGTSTVLLGFPCDDAYEGCGVFSHIVPLQQACRVSHPATMEPVLFEGTVDEKHIVRPSYAPGKELIVYRDIDVLHSSPDVAYRTSIMRFM